MKNNNLLKFLLALVFLQLPVIGYCDSGTEWIKGLFESKDLVLTREVVIQREGLFWGSPNAITKANDEGYVIAGEFWAIKIDSNGKVLWKYIRDKLRADFKGVVAMQDGTTFLCGDMRTDPYDKADKYEYRPIILTHLDAAGHFLNERLILPKIRSDRGVLFSTGCIRWGNNVAIVGHLLHSGAHVEGLTNPNTDQCYWLLVVDSNGNSKWEKQIESWDGIGGAVPPIVLSDSSLVFAGKSFNKTELMRFNTEGDLVANKSLAGNFIFVHTDTANGEIQLYGFDRDKKIGTALTLDSQFNEVKHVEGKEAPDSVPSVAYRTPDQSLVLFGRKMHTSGEQFTSAIAKIDSNLKSVHWIELAQGAYSDTGTVDASSPTGKSGEFVAARILINLHEVPGSDLARVGMALDFIQIK